MKNIEPELLKQLLNYDPETGVLVWKPRPREMFNDDVSFKKWNTRCANKIAKGTPRYDGYLCITIFGRPWLMHRIVYALHHGQHPEVIDHINGNRQDNRIDNLRNVTHAENRLNSGMVRRNTSGRTGVHWSKHVNKWVARINRNGVTKHLCVSEDFNVACAARAKAERDLGYHENHGRKVV